jgi:transcriptional regulator with GAF, ATPase, and Fis domain
MTAVNGAREYPPEEVKGRLAFGTIVGGSAAMSAVLEQVELVAPTNAPTLILGESGTGKELIASAIHERSPRRDHPLVRVNCGSIPSELFESEFFGHARGSFTGAVRDRIGRFQHADGGTLFLDEVGEIPPAHQAKLLRVLQDGRFQRVGEDSTRVSDVRIIAATNRNLRAEVAAGQFRQDLFYRINVFPLAIPPLRNRREDIPALARHFVSVFRSQLERPAVRLTDEDAGLLQEYDWPGNIRELQNVIQRAIILAQGSRLCLDAALANDRPPEPLDQSSAPEIGRNGILRGEDLKRLERESILNALERSKRRVSGSGGAAELLGVNPSTLASRMRALGIRRRE